ncbi:MAG: hypothetical protein ABJ013_04090 [Halioglobus sp.]
MIAPIAQAETIEDLIAAGKLEASVLVKTPAPHFQKAPLLITVEVGTPGHFGTGVRVRDFAVPGSVVRPVSKFAFNESRRREGDTWTFQSWSFHLYAERPGALRIPALTTFVSVDAETNGVVEGELKLQVPPLKIVAPPETKGLASWVAATGFEVDESWEGVLETYQIGDAVTRVRRFTINDVPAMAIPASPDVEIDGIQVYYAPALVDDKTVGSSLKGVREERVIFTIKAGGTHTIPGHQIHWFNMNTRRVEQIDFASRTFEVEGGTTPDAAAAPEPSGKMENLLYWVMAVLGAALGYLLLRWLRRTSWYHYGRDYLEVWRSYHRIKTDFMRAAAQQDSRLCLALLYRRLSVHAEWQLSTVCASDPKLSAIAAALNAHAYSDGQPPEVGELQHLWQVCTKPEKPHDNEYELRLNPEPSQ